MPKRTGTSSRKGELGTAAGLLVEIVADMEHELIKSRFQFLRRQQRHIRATIFIGADGFQKFRLFVAHPPEFDLHSLGGAAIGGIKNVRA